MAGADRGDRARLALRARGLPARDRPGPRRLDPHPALSGWVLAAVAVAVLLLGACTVQAPERTTTPSGPPVASIQTLSCPDPIDGDPPPADFEVVLGAVALPTSRTSRALAAPDTGPGTTPRLFAKTGLLVRAGQAAELRAQAPAGNRVGIGWGGAPSAPTERFVVPACPDALGTGWLVYAGGYWADRPLCLPLVVRAGGREQQVTIGVGTACPGQRPPVAPG